VEGLPEILCGAASGNCFAKTKTPETVASGVLMAMNPRVPWTMHRPVQPSDGVSRLPRILASSNWAGDGASGCPDSRIYRRLWLPSSRLPRHFATPAPPLMSLRVAPNRHPPACLRPISGFPQISTFRLASGLSLRVAPAAAPFGLPRDGFPGCPGRSFPWRRLQVDLRVSPNLAPSGDTASASSERSESCVYGWADDDFPARLEPCIPGPRPWMNLRVKSGLARSCSALNALSISFSLPLP
jgi:hypothetical protein